ncbi:MAG: PAS domain S-box protein [Verrucomicrobia bacterium]|nr:PAS domain S-box protein [Verrucomicrobiota bacterium]
MDRTLRTINACTQTLARATTEPALLADICRLIVENGGYRMSWVGFAENDEEKTVRCVASAGFEEGYLATARITWSETSERGRGPTGTAIRTGQIVACNDVQSDPNMAPWRREAVKHGYASSIVLPLKKGEKTFGVLTIYAIEPNAFDATELALLKGLADDMAFGIHAMRSQVERAAAMEALRAQETRLAFLLGNTPAIIYSLIATGDFATTFVSPNVQEVLGYPPEAFLKSPEFWLSHLHPDDAAAAISTFHQLPSAGTLTREYRFRHADGTYRWMRDEMRLVRDRQGQPETVAGYWLDITESKCTELKLRQSEEQFRKLFEQHSAAKLVIDPASGRIVNANQAAATFYGWSVEELRQMQIQQINALPPAEVANEMAKAHQKQATRFEFRHRRADGSIRDVEVFSTLIETSKNALLYSNVHDVTERKRAEEGLLRSERLLRQAQEAAQIGYYINNLATGLWESSPSLDRLFGIGPDFVRDTDSWGTLMHPNDRERTVSYFRRIIAERRSFRMDYRIIRPSDGQLRWMAGYGDFECDAAGKAVRLIGCIQDITDRKVAEEALRKREEIFSGIVNQAADAIILIDAATGQFVEFNPAAHEGLGYSREEFAALGIRDIQAEHTSEQIRENLARIQELGSSAFDTRHRHRDGTLRDVHVSVRRINLQDHNYIVAICRDITESRRTQMQLQTLSLAVAQNPSAIVITDPAGLIEYVNPRLTAVTGYTLDELRGQNSRIFKSGAHPTAVYEELWRKISRGEVWRGELVNRKKDGSLHTELVVIAPVKDPEDRTTHYVAVKEDITQAKETLAALETQRRLLADVIENSSLMICFKDREGRYTLVNRRFEEVMERKRGREVLTEGKSLTFEETLSDATGNRTFVAVKFPLRGNKGEITGTCGMILDITDRKRIEEDHSRLATAVEQSGETIIITDKEGTILYANPAFEKTSGYTRAEALGKNPRIFKSGKQDQEFYRQMWQTLRRGETWRGHFINQRKNGSVYEEDTSISPIRDAIGNVVNYVAVKHDVTHELQLEAQFRQAQKMDAIGTLAGGIAHDFNNILTVISGYGGMLRDELADSPEAQDKIIEILKASDRARDLVQQILTFSRQREQKREIIQLNSVIKEAAKFLRASLPSNIQIDLHLDAGTPPVLADPTQIYQTAINLGTNALHAMEGLNGRLALKLESFSPDQAWVRAHPDFRPVQYARLTVADTGHGMDARTLEHIFEPFFTTKPVGKGTGLGLAVVHGIDQSHDAIITVDSQPGRGTTFTVYFPAQQKQEELSAELATKPVPLGQGETILIVDDEVVVTVMMQRLLKRLNYEATTLNSPTEALALFSRNPDAFDIVLTDLTMPEMSGLEVARQMHAIRPDLPIILMSGFSASVLPKALGEVGILKMLEKPLSALNLAETLQHNLAVGSQ